MTTHYLKIKDIYYNDILNGSKTFELRKNDRDFQFGDLIQFQPENNELDTPLFQIVYVLKDVPQYGLAKGYAILGIEKE